MSGRVSYSLAKLLNKSNSVPAKTDETTELVEIN